MPIRKVSGGYRVNGRTFVHRKSAVQAMRTARVSRGAAGNRARKMKTRTRGKRR